MFVDIGIGKIGETRQDLEHIQADIKGCTYQLSKWVVHALDKNELPPHHELPSPSDFPDNDRLQRAVELLGNARQLDADAGEAMESINKAMAMAKRVDDSVSEPTVRFDEHSFDRVFTNVDELHRFTAALRSHMAIAGLTEEDWHEFQAQNVRLAASAGTDNAADDPLGQAIEELNIRGPVL